MKVILFGIGNYYQIQKPKLKSLPDLEILAFSDNNEKVWGKNFDDAFVIPPASIPSFHFDKVVIVSLYVSEIFHQLVELGIKRDKILSWPLFWSGQMQGKRNLFSSGIEQKADRKNILIVSNDLHYDGASLAAVYAAAAFQNCWNVMLAVPDGDSRMIHEIVETGIAVMICPVLPWIGRAEKEWMTQFDVVMVNTYPMVESVLEMAKLCPTLWWVHEASGNYPIVEMQYPDGIVEKEFSNVCICAVSEIARQNFNYVYPGRLKKILPLGIPDRKENGDILKKENSKVIFAVIGAVYEAKGQDIFLDAASKVKNNAKAEFWIIGRMDDTKYCRKIKEQARGLKSVRLWGELTRNEIYRVISMIDVMVCVSQEETLSITVIEGMMAGKACITTKHTGIADYLEDGKSGFVIEYKDVDALAEKMEWMIAHKEKLERFGMAARETYEACFCMDIFRKNLEEMIKETEKEWKARER